MRTRIYQLHGKRYVTSTDGVSVGYIKSGRYGLWHGYSFDLAKKSPICGSAVEAEEWVMAQTEMTFCGECFA